MAAKEQNNVKYGYNLAAEALDYLADKLSSTRNDDDQLKVKSELIKQGLDANVKDYRQKARRLRELYQRRDRSAPQPGTRERESYILSLDEERSEVNSMRELICVALGIYRDDIIQTREDIPKLVTTRKPTEEYSQTFLKMDDVERQLRLIEEAMEKDYHCGK